VRVGVRKEYKGQRGYSVICGDETVQVRLIKKFSEMIDDVDLSRAHVGDILTLRRRDGEMLLAEGWAEPCHADYLAEAADASGSATAEPSVSPSWPVVGRSRRLLRGRSPRRSRLSDYQWIASAPLNTMLIGPRNLTHEILKTVGRQLEAPVVHVKSNGHLRLPPPGSRGTVVLDDVERLTLEDQRRLFDWLGSIPTHTRVVCTSTRPLTNVLLGGTFLDGLYYRLNTLYVPVTSRTA
jgi:sigma-54-interacting transcriptional regulator